LLEKEASQPIEKSFPQSHGETGGGTGTGGTETGEKEKGRERYDRLFVGCCYLQQRTQIVIAHKFLYDFTPSSWVPWFQLLKIKRGFNGKNGV
jgi:hypothetical protein